MALILCLCLQSARMQLCRHAQLTALHLFLQASQSFCAFYFIEKLDFFQWVRIMEHFIVGGHMGPYIGEQGLDGRVRASLLENYKLVELQK